MKVVDEVFIGIGGFFPDILLGKEVGMGQGGGCISLYDLIRLIVVRGSICVVWDVNRSFSPIDLGIDFFQPRSA